MTDALDFATGRSTESAAGKPRSLADRIKADIAARRTRTVDLTHLDSPLWSITYRLPDDGFIVDDLRQKAHKKDKGKGAEVHFSRALLAYFCERITFEGNVLEDEGHELTFRDIALQDMVDAPTATDAVNKLYGSDAAVTVIAMKLLDEAGYGSQDSVEITDPTQAY